ncbi:unnamed protein product, partial [Ectocarpus sp. 4 AP-2014]
VESLEAEIHLGHAFQAGPPDRTARRRRRAEKSDQLSGPLVSFLYHASVGVCFLFRIFLIFCVRFEVCFLFTFLSVPHRLKVFLNKRFLSPQLYTGAKIFRRFLRI